MWLSITAHSRLFALVIAWKSPVKWRLISSDGSTVAFPPPIAPPLIPKTGPRTTAFFPILLSPIPSPIDCVVFPSPNGVGLIEVISINFAFGLSLIVS